MAASGQSISFLDHHRTAGEVQVKELSDHRDGLGIAHHLYLGPAAQQIAQGGTVVRLHVVHHHIVQRTARQGKLQILKKPLPHGLVYRVHQDRLFIQHQIAVIADAPGDRKHVFKLGQPAVRCPQPIQIVMNVGYTMHMFLLPFYTSTRGKAV